MDEFNIDFRNKEVQLIKFLNKFGINQRVNIRIPFNVSEIDIDFLLSLFEIKKYNVVVCFDHSYNQRNSEEIVKKFQEHKIPFYFEYPIDNYDELYGIMSLGVTDLFISGELGFDLERVSKVVKGKNENIQLRCYANICQGRWSGKEDTFKDFFIRPEDIDIYGQYIDVIEFYNSENIQNTLYEVYFHSKEWNGNLQELVQGLTVKIDNYYILGNEFGNRRSKCQKKCMKAERCELCERVRELADTLEKSKDYDVFKRRQ